MFIHILKYARLIPFESESFNSLSELFLKEIGWVQLNIWIKHTPIKLLVMALIWWCKEPIPFSSAMLLSEHYNYFFLWKSIVLTINENMKFLRIQFFWNQLYSADYNMCLWILLPPQDLPNCQNERICQLIKSEELHST